MNISLNWLKEFIDINDQPEIIAEKLTAGGLEVEAISDFESIPGGLEGIVIGEVLTCEKHPNADKLSITTVDIGDGEPKPIVCGAPNVAKGQKVLVATVGATIHPTEGDSFSIKKAKIRGEVSEGMICAEDELGLGKSHDGILVLDTDLLNGSPASKIFENYSDKIIEIGLTPNRGDAASHLGVARDLKAIYRKNLKSFIPELALDAPERKGFSVELKNPEACIRYAGVVLENIKVGPSPKWLQNKLKAIGAKPINNVVDVTNFILHDLGQPLHAFDLSAISGDQVIVKTGFAKQKFKTLDDVERELHQEDLMICNAEGPMCIAGVFGGADSGVKDSTTSIFLESACFDPVFVRKTSMRHGLKTDAAFRFERGTDPNVVMDALKKAVHLLQEVAGAQLASQTFDIYPNAGKIKEVVLKKSDIKRLIGVEIPHEEVLSILKHLDILVKSEDAEKWTFEVPSYRVEVDRPADIIEEILRIYGFNKIEADVHSNADFLAPFDENDLTLLQNKLADYLTGFGLNEVQNNSLTSAKHPLLGQTFGENSESVAMLNRLSEELGVMRESMLFTGLDTLRYNINRRQSNLKFFEFGKVYAKLGGTYVEKNKIALFLTGQNNEESWMQAAEESNFFQLKTLIFNALQRLGINNVKLASTEIATFQSGGFGFTIGKKTLAFGGEVSKKVLKNADILQKVFFAELDMDLIRERRMTDFQFTEISKFPEVRRDLSLVLDKQVKFEEIAQIAEAVAGKFLKDINVFDVYEGKPLESNQKSCAISFILQDDNGTLADKKIDTVMNKLIENYESKIGALIRR